MSDATRSAIEALETAGQRAKVHDAVMNTKLPSAVKALVNTIAKERDVSDSLIVREALAEYLTRRGYANH